jgi:hypothetical protein
VVDFTKSCKSKISRKCEFQPIKSFEITLTINLRLTTFCEIDPRNRKSEKDRQCNGQMKMDKMTNNYLQWLKHINNVNNEFSIYDLYIH